MKATEKRSGVAPSLVPEPSVIHRGGLAGDGPLFPPPETYAAIGGRVTVERLVDRLYDGFEADPVLRRVFARHLDEERGKVKLFFAEWLGGNAGYFDSIWRHGLRATHAGVMISRGMAGRWVGHFLDAASDAIEDASVVAMLRPYITRFAMAMVNRETEPDADERLRGNCSAGEVDRLTRYIARDDAEGLRAALTAELPKAAAAGLLLLAAVRGKPAAAAALLAAGADGNVPATLTGAEASALRLPSLPITPLCGALAKRRDAVVQVLVAHGAQYDVFTAAFLGDDDTVAHLLDVAPELANAIDPACDVARITPLLHAVAAGQTSTMRLLLSRGAAVGPNSPRLLTMAGAAGSLEMIDLLLEHGADASRLEVGRWVTHEATARRLVGAGADVNVPAGAWIGLCCTGNSGHKENPPLARALLALGADVAARYKGRTALHCAAKAGFLTIAEELIGAGADVNSVNDWGETPLDDVENAARTIDRAPLRRLLETHGGRRRLGS